MTSLLHGRSAPLPLLALVALHLPLFALSPRQPPAATPATAQPADAAAEPIPPQLLLGKRIQTLRDAVSASANLVIVTDAASYIEAIAHWTPTNRFPVLIDDGSPRSRDDIARFVRGYAPTNVLRWHQKQSSTSPAADPGPAGFNAAPTSLLTSALARIWASQPTNPASPQPLTLPQAFLARGHTPPGIVVCHQGDPAWTAALPLAAAWGQHLCILEQKPGINIDHAMTIEESDTLEATLETFVQSTGDTWQSLGQGIDAITLCLNIPERITHGKEFVALSDRIGRRGPGLATRERWAWSGHIFGTASDGAYRAMSSLFLHPRRAWVFDGYPTTAPWNLFDGTKTAEYLTSAGLKCELDDSPSQGAGHWRARAANMLTADLIFVNTKGNSDFFDLEPGQCKPGDIPFLTRPAALHFVHSWSLLFPGKRESVGGRWLERGVFVYAGSVHEPFLQAFTPTPSVAGRLMSGAPFAPAIRVEGQPVWKIAVLGDPLYTPGPALKRHTDPLPPPFDSASNLGDGLKQLLADKSWDQGVATLKLLGRDADLAKLVAALAEATPAALSPLVLREGALAAFATGNSKLLFALVAKTTTPLDPVVVDALWLALTPLLSQPPILTPVEKRAATAATEGTTTQSQRPDLALAMRTLKDHLRPDQLEQDARLLAAAWARQFGQPAVGGLFTAWRAKYSSPDQRTALEKAQRP